MTDQNAFRHTCRAGSEIYIERIRVQMLSSYFAKAVFIRRGFLKGCDLQDPAGREYFPGLREMIDVGQDDAGIQTLLNLSLAPGRQGGIDQAVECARINHTEKGGQCIHLFFHEYDNRTAPTDTFQKTTSHAPAKIEQLCAGIGLLSIAHRYCFRISFCGSFQVFQYIYHRKLLSRRRKSASSTGIL